MAAVEPRIKNGVLKGRTLSFNFNPFVETSELEVTDTILPIRTQVKGESVSGSAENFNQACYWSHLNTKELGQCVVYVDVINTTMKMFDRYVTSFF